MRIGVIGNGLMGKGIVQCLLDAEYEVTWFGRRDSFKNDMMKYYQKMHSKGYCTDDCLFKVENGIRYRNSKNQLNEIKECGVIIETISESKAGKIELIQALNEHVEDSQFLFSNTSTIPIKYLSSAYKFKNNTAGLHFFSPVPLMDIVEIVKEEGTCEQAVHSAIDICEKIGKKAIVVKDTPGFVFNRMLVPLVNEASILYHSHYTGQPEIIDEIFRRGMGLKYGPLRLADLTGVDIIYDSMHSIFTETGDPKYKPCNGMKAMVENGLNGRKAGAGFYKY